MRYRDMKRNKQKGNKMNWYNQVKETLGSPSLRGFRADFQVTPHGENWDGDFRQGKKLAEKQMKALGNGTICLLKYSLPKFGRGVEMIEDTSSIFDFKVIDGKIVLSNEYAIR